MKSTETPPHRAGKGAYRVYQTPPQPRIRRDPSIRCFEQELARPAFAASGGTGTPSQVKARGGSSAERTKGNPGGLTQAAPRRKQTFQALPPRRAGDTSPASPALRAPVSAPAGPAPASPGPGLPAAAKRRPHGAQGPRSGRSPQVRRRPAPGTAGRPAGPRRPPRLAG